MVDGRRLDERWERDGRMKDEWSGGRRRQEEINGHMDEWIQQGSVIENNESI